jgi:peptidoglycan hydrolase CwlO-like protein
MRKYVDILDEADQVQAVQSAQATDQTQPQQLATKERALIQQQKDLQANLQSLKSLNPDLDTARLLTALQKSPEQVSAVDAKLFSELLNTLGPVLRNRQAFTGVRTQAQRLTPKV